MNSSIQNLKSLEILISRCRFADDAISTASLSKKIREVIKMQFNNLEQYYINQTLIQETADQIIKDFSEFSFKLTFSGEKETPYDELFSQLWPIIDWLLEKEQEKFMSIVYRIDLDERELKQALFPEEGKDPAQQIADLIIKRELKKVVIRNYFKRQQD